MERKKERKEGEGCGGRQIDRQTDRKSEGWIDG